MNFKSIFNKMPLFFIEGQRFLDLGCGSGDFLFFLKNSYGSTCYGIEKNVENIKKCMLKGLPVFQGNIEDCLPNLRTQSYDLVILSQTLQEIQNPVFVINEMLRIGKRALIIFPNFAYWPSRLHLFFGRAPRHNSLPFSWFSTPNIRAITINDFVSMCRENRFRIVHSQPLLKKFPSFLCFPFLRNLFCPQAIFILESDYEG